MNTLHFKYALEVAKTKSITQAAENLFMAQPNLSKAIKELEASLNITIFERSTRGVVPTAEGAAFLDSAQRIMSEIKQMEQISKSVSYNSLCVCIPQSFFAVDAAAEFIKMNKDISLETDIFKTTPLSAISEITYNNYKMAVVRVDSYDADNFVKYCTDHGLSSKEIWEFASKAIVSAESPLANKQILTDDMLKDLVLLSDKDEVLPYHLKKISENPRFKRIFVNSLEIRLELFHSSKKYWMIDSPVTRDFLKRNNLSQVSYENNYSYHDYIVFKKDYKFNYAEKMFLDCIYSVKNTIDYVENTEY